MTRPDPDDWETWLAANPPPRLSDLLDKHGKYGEIPQPAWDRFDKEFQDWNSRRLDRLFGSRAWAIPVAKRHGR